MKVLLLGAGASKSYGQSPTGQRMPVARDFFQTFDHLAISANPWVLQEGIIGYLLSKNIDDPHSYLRSGVDIEAFHSEIEQIRNQAIAQGKDIIEYFHESRAYNELIFLFSSVINEIQNGPISETHRKIAKFIKPNDAIITFNWDTLMDRALAAETAWQLDWGYEVTPLAVFSDGWRAPVPVSERKQHPRLVKLHGSTNWITAYSTMGNEGKIVLSHELDPSTLYLFEFATNKYDCWAGRYMPNYQPFSYGYYPPNLIDIPGRRAPEGKKFVRVRAKVPWRDEGTAPDGGLVSMPLIIPPVKNKSKHPAWTAAG